MRRRDLLKFAGATALAAPFLRAARADQTTIKIGVVGPKTGPLRARLSPISRPISFGHTR
jgi:hypothetical protein